MTTSTAADIASPAKFDPLIISAVTKKSVNVKEAASTIMVVKVSSAVRLSVMMVTGFVKSVVQASQSSRLVGRRLGCNFRLIAIQSAFTVAD